MSQSNNKKNNVVKIDHNSNRSISEEFAKKFQEENWYLNDCIITAIKTIAKLWLGSEKINDSLEDLSTAKNNWDRSVHANQALKTSNHQLRDLQIFKNTIRALLYRKDLYQQPQKHHTLELGSHKQNFGLYFANNENELQETIKQAYKNWCEEEYKDNE